jgi:hypothetical protein
VACRTARKARAREARRRDCERRAAVPAPVEQADDVAWRELRPVLDEAVSGLPDKYRLPFVLHHLQGLTVAETARRLGCPEGTAAARLARAKERLRARLTRRGVTLSASALTAVLSAGTGWAAVSAPPAWSATPAAVGFPAPHAVPLAKGVLGMMSTTKPATAAVLLAVVTGATGVAVSTRRAQAEAASPPAAASENPGGARPGTPAAGPEDEVYAALREDGWWQSPAGDVTIHVAGVDRRRLLNVTLKRRDSRGRVTWVATCREAELLADPPTKTLRIRMKQGTAHQPDGSQAWWEDRVVELLSLAPPQGGPGDEADRPLRAAFGEDALNAPVKMVFRSRGLVLAADTLSIEGGGRVRLNRCRLAFCEGKPGAVAVLVRALRADEVRLTFDRPILVAGDVGRRRLTAVEPAGNVRITFPVGE